MFNSFKKISPSDDNSPETDTPVSPFSPSPTPAPWQAEEEESRPAAMPPSFASSANRSQPTRNVLNSDVEVVGTLTFQEDLLIDGIVEGKINSEGTLTIGQNARIQAEIRTKSIIIHGKVIGNITVSDRVELKATAELVGDIQAAAFSVESGAIFIGHSTVGAPSMDIPKRAAKKAPAKQATLPVEEEAKTDDAKPVAPAPDFGTSTGSTTQEMQF